MREPTDALRELADIVDEMGRVITTHDHTGKSATWYKRLAAVLPVLAQQQENLKDSNSVCACGCADADHENYGEDGEDCDLPGHECIRTNRAVLEMLNSLREQLTEAEATRKELVIAETNLSVVCDDYRELLLDVESLRKQLQEAEATRRSLEAKAKEIRDVESEGFFCAHEEVRDLVNDLLAESDPERARTP